MPPNSELNLEQILGRDTLKKVYSYFPPNPPKGVVWFFHGTGGSATAFVSSFDSRQLINHCIIDTFAVIITECEETTKNEDLNNDGNLKRWHYEPDSINNVDFANIRAIRDTFIHRGHINSATPHIGIGFSAGGAMALIMGWYNKWKAGVTFGTGGVPIAAQNSQSPTMIIPNRRDDHPEVGPESIDTAFINQQNYLERGICSIVYVNEPTPLHKDRFTRKITINSLESTNIFNDLQNNGCLGPNNYLIKTPDQIVQMAQANPSSWTSLTPLTGSDIEFVKDQLRVLWAAHQFPSDFYGRTLRFINKACGGFVSERPEPHFSSHLQIVPNPASTSFYISGMESGWVEVYNLTGQLLIHQSVAPVAIGHLLPGIYWVKTEIGIGKLVKLP